jgi:N-acetylglucosaminyldiphosphoundecaprenol N-acetyl-beta-D-mannosaminyltransferase
MKKVNLLGVKIDALSLDQMLAIISQTNLRDERKMIMHANLMAVNMAYENPWYREILNSADLLFCDGMGLQLGARFLGDDIPERFTLADWMWKLAPLASEKNFSFFLLGNPPGVAQKAAENLRDANPNLRIAGIRHGYFDKTKGHVENKEVVDVINASGANILMIGFGMPLQEQWLFENWPQLNVNIAITCGALFEYLSGDLKRGPDWMTQNYMEWLARIIISPKRYIRRYLLDLPKFAYRVLKQKSRNGTERSLNQEI